MSARVGSDVGPFAIAPLWLAEMVSPTALKVFVVLAGKYADRSNNEAFPARRTLAADCSIGETTLDNALKELRDAGALSVEKQTARNGAVTVNRYTCTYSRVQVYPLTGTPVPADGEASISPRIIEPEPLEPEPENEIARAPAHPFAFLFAREYMQRNNGRPAAPEKTAHALALEREYGADACIQVARDYQWSKHPAYYRPILEERRNANAGAANSGKPDVQPSANGVDAGVSQLDRREPSIADQRRLRFV